MNRNLEIQPTIGTGNQAISIVEPLVLSVPEFGARYGMKKTTVYKWIGLGMPHLKLSQRKTLVPIKEADQWMKDNFYRQREC